MAHRHVLALDQGTTSSRAIVFDGAGQVVALAQQEFPQVYPQPGWVEHDPEAIWESQLAVARAALAQAGLRADELAAVGVTNQRETALAWDRRTGRPLANAIVWQCRRTAAFCEQLKADGLSDLVRQRTGLVIDAYFSASKWRWFLDNVPGLRAAAERGEVAFGTVDSFLLWRLTGGQVHATDVSNASRTLVYNIHTRDWDDELLRQLAIPRQCLPAVRPSSGRFGETSAQWLGAPVPIGGVAGDQQAATFGQACFDPGQAKNTYGTGSFLLLNTGNAPVESQHGLLTTIGWQIGTQTVYCLEGSIFITGAAVQWLRDELGLIEQSGQIEALAASVPDSGGVYFVPAFVGLGAPYWDPYARGAILGLTRGSNRGHLARAVLEAMAYQTREVAEAMTADCGLALAELRVDGGAVVNNLLLQTQADVLGVPVLRPRVSETTALGAATLAGLAVGLWPDQATLARQWALDRRFEPQLATAARETGYRGWRRAVERTRGWADPTGE